MQTLVKLSSVSHDCSAVNGDVRYNNRMARAREVNNNIIWQERF